MVSLSTESSQKVRTSIQQSPEAFGKSVMGFGAELGSPFCSWRCRGWADLRDGSCWEWCVRSGEAEALSMGSVCVPRVYEQSELRKHEDLGRCDCWMPPEFCWSKTCSKTQGIDGLFLVSLTLTTLLNCCSLLLLFIQYLLFLTLLQQQSHIIQTLPSVYRLVHSSELNFAWAALWVKEIPSGGVCLSPLATQCSCGYHWDEQFLVALNEDSSERMLLGFVGGPTSYSALQGDLSNLHLLRLFLLPPLSESDFSCSLHCCSVLAVFGLWKFRLGSGTFEHYLFGSASSRTHW